MRLLGVTISLLTVESCYRVLLTKGMKYLQLNPHKCSDFSSLVTFAFPISERQVSKGCLFLVLLPEF